MILYGTRRARPPCWTASPRPSWPSCTSTPPTPTGPASCGGRPPLPRASAGASACGAADRHPAAGTPLGLRPLGTLRPLEDILALLTRAGFSGPDALHIYRALFGFLHGHVLDELQELTVSPDETDDLLRLGLHRLPIGDFPLLRGLAPVLAAYDGAAELERGLDILLTGLTTTLTPPARPARPRGERRA